MYAEVGDANFRILFLIPFCERSTVVDTAVLPRTTIITVSHTSHLTDPPWLRTESYWIDFGISQSFYRRIQPYSTLHQKWLSDLRLIVPVLVSHAFHYRAFLHNHQSWIRYYSNSEVEPWWSGQSANIHPRPWRIWPFRTVRPGKIDQPRLHASRPWRYGQDRRGIGLLSSLGNRLWRLAMCCGMFMSLLELQLESITNLLRGPSYSNRMPYNKSLTLMNDRCGDGFCVTCKAIILGKAYVYTIPILGGLMYGADPSLTLPISYIRNIAGGSSHMNLSGPSNG